MAYRDGSTSDGNLRRSSSVPQDGRQCSVPRIIQLRRSSSLNGRCYGCGGKSRLGRSPFGRNLSDLELDQTVEGENENDEEESSSEIRRSPSRKEMEEIIERESKNTEEYTSLSPLVRYARSDSMQSPKRPLLRNSVLEKAAAVYLRASFSSSQDDECACPFWQSCCRCLSWIIPFSCLGLTSGTSDPKDY